MPAVGGVGLALVGLQVTQPAAEQVLVHEGIVDQLGEHEYPARGVFRQRLVGALNGVLHAEAEPEVARNHISHRPKIERDRSGRRALVLAGDRLDRDAELRLVQPARHGVLRVNGGVALRRRPELVDEVVLAEMQVGDFYEIRFELPEQREQGGRQGARLRRQGIERMEDDLRFAGRSADLREEHAATLAGGVGGEIFRGGSVFGKRGLQAGRGRGDFVTGEGGFESVADPPHGELVARVEGEHGADARHRRGRSHGQSRRTSASLVASLPPPMAKSGLPPPLPSSLAASSAARLPA